jgi:hypothetical protein
MRRPCLRTPMAAGSAVIGHADDHAWQASHRHERSLDGGGAVNAREGTA